MSSRAFCFASPATVVWRAHGVLQVGLDRQRSIVLEKSPRDADRALRCFARPRSTDQIGALLPCLDRTWLHIAAATLRRHGILVDAARSVTTVLMLGEGALADACASALALVPDVDVSRASDLRAVSLLDHRAPVVVVGPTIEPDRRLLADLVSHRRPHLVVRGEPERLIVGPFVEVGRRACIRCTDLVRRDLDPRWPHVLAQLCRMQHDPDPTGSGWAAATAAAQVRAHLSGHAPQSAGATIELSTESYAVGVRPWSVHPECGCAWGVRETRPGPGVGVDQEWAATTASNDRP